MALEQRKLMTCLLFTYKWDRWGKLLPVIAANGSPIRNPSFQSSLAQQSKTTSVSWTGRHEAGVNAPLRPEGWTPEDNCNDKKLRVPWTCWWGHSEWAGHRPGTWAHGLQWPCGMRKHQTTTDPLPGTRQIKTEQLACRDCYQPSSIMSWTKHHLSWDQAASFELIWWLIHLYCSFNSAIDALINIWSHSEYASSAALLWKWKKKSFY